MSSSWDSEATLALPSRARAWARARSAASNPVCDLSGVRWGRAWLTWRWVRMFARQDSAPTMTLVTSELRVPYTPSIPPIQSMIKAVSVAMSGAMMVSRMSRRPVASSTLMINGWAHICLVAEGRNAVRQSTSTTAVNRRSGFGYVQIQASPFSTRWFQRFATVVGDIWRISPAFDQEMRGSICSRLTS